VPILWYRMYTHASSSSVTEALISYHGKKKSMVVAQNWWNFYIWTEESVLLSGEEVHEP